MRLQTGCPCRGRPVFLYALAIPGPVRSSPERPSSGPFFPWVRAKLPSVQADRRGEAGARRCPAGTGCVFHTDDRCAYVREPNGRHPYEVRDRLKRLPLHKGSNMPFMEEMRSADSHCTASWTLAIYLFAARVAESERARKTRGGYLENRIPRRDGTSGDTI